MDEDQARRLLPLLRRLARKHTPPAGTSQEDLVSAASERVVREAKSARYISVPWVIYRAERAMIDEIRRMRPGGRGSSRPDRPEASYDPERNGRTDPPSEPFEESEPMVDAPTTKERDVLRLASTGSDRAETARILGISSETVKEHRAHAQKTLGTRNLVASVAAAIRRGFIR